MHTEECPYCHSICDADWCDIGVGSIQCGPFNCQHCGASEIGPHDNYYNPFKTLFVDEDTHKPGTRILTEEESNTGWYAPASQPGSSANVIDNKVVSHRIMLDTYKKEFTGNPLWADKTYVNNWYEEIRK